MFYITIFIFLILFYFNVLPLLKRKFKNEKLLSFANVIELKSTVLSASLEMLSSNKVFMPFDDEDTLYTKLARLKALILNNRSHRNYAYFNFPRAWLMIGLLDEYKRTRNDEILNNLIIQCNKLISPQGKLLFSFNKVDQALFGIVFIRLNEITKDERYTIAATNIFNRISDFQIEDELILYRKETNVCFVDTSGMVCPFLYEYGAHYKNSEAILLANRQIEFYLKNGIDEKTNLPFHAIDLNNNIRIGSVNWARGFAWLMIGLAYGIKYNSSGKAKEYFNSIFQDFSKAINTLKIDNTHWSQFLGHTNDYSIDSSATLMFYFAIHFANPDSFEENDLLEGIKNSIDSKGFVISSSGDTIYINKYSRAKGKSEMSQGLLVSLLSTLK